MAQMDRSMVESGSPCEVGSSWGRTLGFPLPQDCATPWRLVCRAHLGDFIADRCLVALGTGDLQASKVHKG